MLALTAFVIGPAVSVLPPRTYFSNVEPYAYVVWNMLFQTRYYLPGAFGSDPFPNAVNGSL